MTPTVGFIIESLALSGTGKPLASLTFRDGLNVVTGASDTGKSYALQCIDYAFGASRLSRSIPQAIGYDAITLCIRARQTGHAFEIKRTLEGGDAVVRELDRSGVLVSEKTLGARHDAKDTETLSALLLGLSGLSGKRVRKNKQGEMRTLSFRDVAYLVVVDEERIISERPPHLSGSYTEKTVEGAALRLLATGTEAGEVIAAPKKSSPEATRAKLEVIQQLEAEISAEIERVGMKDVDIEAELGRLEASRNEALAGYDEARVQLGDLERALAIAVRSLREAGSRSVVVEGLERRFELLGGHYESDLSRLEAVEEAGTLLEAFPTAPCPLCGAPPHEHRTEAAEVHFRLDDVRAAARKEAAKVAALQADLSQVIGELAAEQAELHERRERLKAEVKELQTTINSDLQPKLRASADQLRDQTGRRDALLRARTLFEQRADLLRRSQELQTGSRRANASKTSIDASPSTAELEDFVVAVQEVLREWKYPDAGRVVFSEADQDLVIGGQPRASHGKGVRALSCAAFITGLIRHCVVRTLPHPGVVILDSPLVVYREPDEGENRQLRQAGVKDAFYRSLADGAAGGQVIVFENEDPPQDARINRHHFSKSGTGRYGLIPE